MDKEKVSTSKSNQVVARSKTEAFKRIKCQTLAKMMKDTKAKQEKGMEISSYGVKILPTKLFEEEEKKMVGVDLGPETASMTSNKTTESVASIFQANADFMSHAEVKGGEKKGRFDQDFNPKKIDLDSSQFLLLDLRDEEDYNLSHIKGAINFPAPNIARDKFHAQLIKFRNKEGKIVVLYTQDERTGWDSVQMLSDKGWSNLCMLEGGFSKFTEAEDNDELISGRVAHTEIQAKKTMTKRPVRSLEDCPYF